MTGPDEPFGALTDAADPPLVVVTTAAEGVRSGCVVGFHTQSSMDPPHYSVWLSKANHTYRTALRASTFVVHFLTADDLWLVERFGTLTGDDTDKFAGLELEPDPEGVPVLAACPHRARLERIAMLDDGGDHVCLTARVVSAESPGPFAPLRYAAASRLEPGHGNEERAIEP